MLFSKRTLLALLGAASTISALPTTATLNLHAISALLPRQSCVDTCGSNCYSQSDIAAALNAGVSLYQAGQTEGYSKYPHEYYDDEGFSFPVAGPYLEFPILSDEQVYAGGSPGADRVVFNDSGDFAGLITHTGASGDGFTQCQAD